MNLRDNELAMLEQLCYLNDKIAEAAGVSGFTGVRPGNKGQTIKEILSCFDEEALKRLENPENNNLEWASGKRWAAIIRYLKSNSNLSNLTLAEVMSGGTGTLAMCFTDGTNSDDAVVAFKGTSGDKEWIDNVEGLNQQDTKGQKEALDFIESLPYGHITVTGHSKGGNKAMYVAITSDKVWRCVSYDGQGFSREFLEKYRAEIEERGKWIKSYSLNTDYVHILLFSIPNAEQIYCEGYGSNGKGVDNIGQHHSSVSFFVADENGNIQFDSDGLPILEITDREDENIQILREFIEYIMDNTSAEEKKAIVAYLSKILSEVFTKNLETEELINIVLSDPDTLAVVLAYLIRYMEINDLSSKDINTILKMLIVDSLDDILTITIKGKKIKGLAAIIEYVKGHMTDNDDDWITAYIILPVLKKLLAKDIDFDVTAFWQKIDQKVRNLKEQKNIRRYSFNSRNGNTGKIRDFSINVYTGLMNGINSYDNACVSDFASWTKYSSEKWYSSLFIQLAIKGISVYNKKIREVNVECRKKINDIFLNVDNIDRNYSNQIRNVTEEIQTLKIGRG